MPAEFVTGFFTENKAAWHGLGTVLDHYPTREEGMPLAGHDFDVVERPFYLPTVLGPDDDLQDGDPWTLLDDADGTPWVNRLDRAQGWKALTMTVPGHPEDPRNGRLLNVVRDSYGVIQNSVGWDIMDALVGEGVKYVTGLTLKDGAVCSLLGYLDQPVVIPGDDSPILPFVNVAWAHDGSAGLSARSTSIRTVCSNTQSAAEAEGRRLETEYVFRHTRNVMDRIEDAKKAITGVLAGHGAYVELATELAAIKVNKAQRNEFRDRFIPMPLDIEITDRVANNIEEARGALMALFDGPTIPDAHRFTAYGLHLAGVEYLDHIRGYRNDTTRYGRSILRREPLKAKLGALIRDVVTA